MLYILCIITITIKLSNPRKVDIFICDSIIIISFFITNAI